MSTSLTLDTPSRLKGIETCRYTSIKFVSIPLDTPSRLKELKPALSRCGSGHRESLDTPFPFEGN